MPIIAFLAPIVSWIFRAVVVKFVVLTAVFALVNTLLPLVINMIAGYVSGAQLSQVFGGLDPGIWFFLDFFYLSYGLPLIISAYITRFMIRRMPVIG